MKKNKDYFFAIDLRFILLFSILTAYVCAATGANSSNVKNFSKNIYKASNQNWSISESPNGFMYFANHKGLLEFDGVSWKLYKLPNETILRAVKVAPDSTIYTSGYRELGFWKADKKGILHYHSINDIAEPYFLENQEFWNISILDDAVYFHSFSNILLYKKNKISQINIPGFISTMHRVKNEILIAARDYGIYKIVNDQTVPVIVDPIFEGALTRFILPYEDDKLLIGTNSNGIYIWDGNKLTEWNPRFTEYLKKNEVNRGYITPNGNYIIGTLIDGITVFDKNGKFISSYNTSNGLQNNTVLGITTDHFNNIWLALDIGIGFISKEKTKGFEIETIPEIGAVYDAAVFENKIYLGTNQGLFNRNIYDKDDTFSIVPETQGQVWYCQVIDGQLFIGHNDGTLIIKDGKQKFVSRQSGGFSITKDPLHPDCLIESTYSSMTKTRKKGSTFVQDGIIKGFSNLIRYIEIDHQGIIWASHMHRGIYKLLLNEKRDSVISETYYGENSIFGKDHSLHVFKIENRIVFTTEETLYTYNDLTDSIIPYSLLNEQLGEFKASKRIVKAPNHHYWFISKNRIGLFQILNNNVRFIKDYPQILFESNNLIDDFENILPITETKAIVCLVNGIAQLDAAVSDSKSAISEFKPSLHSFNLTDRRGNQTTLPTNVYKTQIKYKYRNIQLQYSFPFYINKPIYFQYFLKGLDEEWSVKQPTPKFRFDRLPSGNYELLVKATDQWENESQIDVIRFEVAPPWYLTIYAKAAYLFFFILILLAFRSWGIKQTQKKERLEHEKRERELIRLRNDKLRDEVQHKSKELANSTMAIIKKNEFLLEIKKILAKQKEQLGSRLPDKYYYHLNRKIEENISSHDDWNLFETNFERAHEKFLNKIKQSYPELTSKDLKLCAYLRMNLSSKEIAPLLGISVRGVENHRYRLRKKMNMEHDEKLIDMILQL